MMNQEPATDLFGICPYATTQKVISGKWAILILHDLEEKTLRFGQLQRQLPQLTQATLTKQLRMLEEYGLVQRTVYPEVPPKVEYSLTDIGREFRSVLNELERFGEKYISYLKEKAEPSA